MFKLIPDPTFPVRVRLTVPGQEATSDLVLTCRHKPRGAVQAWIDSAKELNDDAKFLGQVVADWGENVQGEDGKPLPYTPEAFAALLDNYASAGMEIFDAYLQELRQSRSKT